MSGVTHKAGKVEGGKSLTSLPLDEKEQNYEAAIALAGVIKTLGALIREKQGALEELPYHECSGTYLNFCDVPVPKAGDKCDRCRAECSTLLLPLDS